MRVLAHSSRSSRRFPSLGDNRPQFFLHHDDRMHRHHEVLPSTTRRATLSRLDSSAEIANAISANDYYDKSILFSGVDKVFGMFFSQAVQKKISALLFASIFGWAYLIIIYNAFLLYVYAVANAVLLYLTAKVFISILFTLGPIFFIFTLHFQYFPLISHTYFIFPILPSLFSSLPHIFISYLIFFIFTSNSLLWKNFYYYYYFVLFIQLTLFSTMILKILLNSTL